MKHFTDKVYGHLITRQLITEHLITRHLIGGAESARLENARLELSGTGNVWNATCGIT